MTKLWTVLIFPEQRILTVELNSDSQVAAVSRQLTEDEVQWLLRNHTNPLKIHFSDGDPEQSVLENTLHSAFANFRGDVSRWRWLGHYY